MASWNSASYDGRYLQLYIAETIDTVNNTSKLDWTLSSIGGNVAYYTIGETTVTINGTQVYHKGQTSWDSRAFPAAKGSVSGSITVSHNSDGSKSISVGFSTRVYYYQPVEYGGSMTLAKIDRASPSVSISTSNITPNAVTVSASASTTCDIWEYSTNGGSSWAQYSTSATTSTSKAITGLSPNTSYTIRVRARKKSNHVYGTSGSTTIKTLGPAILNSVSTLTADNATVNLAFNWTVYSTAFTYSLAIKNGNTTILTITIPAQSSTGTTSKTITLTSAQRTTLLSHMANMKSFTGTFALTTKSGSTQIGSISSKTATIQTTSANSAPTFSGFTFQDSNTTTTGVTGNNQLFVKGYSRLSIAASTATAKNGASITQYEATIDGTTVKSSSTSLSVGALKTAGNLTLTVKAIDSRGYEKSVTKTITVIAYEKISVSSCTMRRVNEVEAITQVSFEANISKILVSGSNKNALNILRYRYKKTSDTAYGGYTTITSQATKTDTKISFSSDEFVSLDPDYSYDIQFWVYDKLTNDYFTVTLPSGTPLLSKRRKKLGINNRRPKAALDVVGGAIIDGLPLADWIIEQGAQNNWNYRKWKSGKKECWINGTMEVENGAANNYSGFYYSKQINVNFPFEFKSIQFGVCDGGAVDRINFLKTATITSKTFGFWVCSLYSSTAKFTIGYRLYVIGT